MGGQSSKPKKSTSISAETIQSMNNLKQLTEVKKILSNKKFQTTKRKLNTQNTLKQITSFEKQINQLNKLTENRINVVNRQRSANLIESQITN